MNIGMSFDDDTNAIFTFFCEVSVFCLMPNVNFVWAYENQNENEILCGKLVKYKYPSVNTHLGFQRNLELSPPPPPPPHTHSQYYITNGVFGCSTTGKPTRSFATERVSLDSV